MMAIRQEDSVNILVGWLRQPDHGDYSSYGYDSFLPNLLRIYLEQKFARDQQVLDRELREQMPAFFAAGWDLCRRGILRPGINRSRAQAMQVH